MKYHSWMLTRLALLSTMWAAHASALANGTPPAAYLYDELARLTQVTYPDGRQVSYSYDDMGNLTSVKTQTRELVVALIGAPVSGVVGVALSYQTQVSNPSLVTGYAVKGLPPGLKMNTSTQPNKDSQAAGVIYGVPSKEGTYTAFISIRTTAGLGPAVPLAITIANPFTKMARGYNLSGNISGEVAPTDLDGGALGGWLSLKTTPSGGFSGLLQLGSLKHTIRGLFDGQSGLAAPITITRAGLTPLTLTLALILDGPDRGQVQATLDDGTTSEAIVISREVWSKTLPATDFAGTKSARYHLAWSTDPADSADTYPQGLGQATVTVTPNGIAKLAGKLADGTGITQSRVLWPDGSLPIFIALYSSKGVLNGRAVLDPGTDFAIHDNVISGSAWWQRPVSTKPGDVFFATGFDTTLTVLGGVYTPPAKGSRVLGLGAGINHAPVELVLSRGGLTPALQSVLTLSTTSAVTAIVPNTNSITVKFTAAAGLVSGSFKVGARTSKFSGLILPATAADPSEAFGYFLLPGATKSEPTLSGSVFIGPP
jgi:YD repeat-containing protein